MSLTPLTPADAHARLAAGARLIDIREPDEHARERIPGAQSLPVAALPPRIEPAPGDARAGDADIIFHCRSGMRTRAHAGALAHAAGGHAFMLEGGLDAWKRAGLPVIRDEAAPLEIMRQVQIAAGALVLAGVGLGLLVSAWFFALAAFAGAGLVFAGLTGWCGMARLLSCMPWNRRTARPSGA